MVFAFFLEKGVISISYIPRTTEAITHTKPRPQKTSRRKNTSSEKAKKQKNNVTTFSGV